MRGNLLRIGGMLKVATAMTALSPSARGAVRGSGAWLKAPAMKAREERQKVMVKARMRDGAAWHDICIVNISAHGLGIQSAEPPERGTYVEICRGTQSVVARVAWAKGHRAGLRSQDVIFIRAFINDNVAPRPRVTQGQPIERRRAPRTRQKHDRSRLAGRFMEFACIALFAGALAVTAFGAVEQALAAPLSRISSALG